MRVSMYSALAGVLLLCAIPPAWAGSVIATGHDPDFHSTYEPGNYLGARHMMQVYVDYAANGKANPRILLVSGVGVDGGERSSADGLTAALVTPGMVSGFDKACAGGDAAAGFLDLDTVLDPAYLAAHYDVIVVASNFGGNLDEADVDVVNAHAQDIRDWLNGSADRGAVFLAESSENDQHDPIPPQKQFRVVPFITAVTPESHNEIESDYVLHAAGIAMGLVPDDINANYSHASFSNDGGLEVVDSTADGRIVTLAGRGQFATHGLEEGPAGGGSASVGGCGAGCHESRAYDLGAACGFAILQFAHDEDKDEADDPDESGDDGDHKEHLHIDDTGDATAADPTIEGDVGVTGGQEADLKKGTIDGALVIDPQALKVKSKEFDLVGGTVTMDLDQAVADAKAASLAMAAMSPSQTFGKLKASTTIAGAAGRNVVKIDEIDLKKGQTLTLDGPADALFVVNVTRKMHVHEATIALTGGVTAGNVVWNFAGDHGDVHLDKCTAYGTILTLDGHVHLDRTTLYGEILSGEDIHVHKGSTVRCQP